MCDTRGKLRVPLNCHSRPMRKYYVVFVGRNPGIYNTWYDTNAEVCRYTGACYKGYTTRREAEEAFADYLRKDSAGPTSSTPVSSNPRPSCNINNESKGCKDLGPLLEAVSDLASETRKLANTVEKNAEKISMLLKQMEMSE